MQPLKFRELLPPLLLWVGIVVAIIVTGLFWFSEIQRADMAVRESVATRARVEEERRALLASQQSDTVPAVLPPTEIRTDDDQRIADVAILVEALDEARERFGIYPVRDAESGEALAVVEDKSPCLELTSGGILTTCPRDPTVPRREYTYVSDGTDYTLEVLLDATTFPCDATEEGCRYRIVNGDVVSAGRP